MVKNKLSKAKTNYKPRGVRLQGRYRQNCFSQKQEQAVPQSMYAKEKEGGNHNVTRILKI
jgi:hypothetical protein